MNNETILRCGDSKEVLKEFKDNSVDMLCSDPPYGYSFMNKGWDKVLPDKEIWNECFRVLKPGAFITIMSAPRTDVLWRISRDLEEAGFDLSFSNIEWVYHSGFPKASDVSKMIDKRGGDLYVQAVKFGEYIKKVREEKGIGITKIDKDLFDGSTRYSWFEGRPAGQNVPTPEDYMKIKEYLELDDRFDFIFNIDKTNVIDTIPMTIGIGGNSERYGDEKEITIPETDLAKKYEGSKAGFQPKPAREIIIVGMKPFEEGSYIDHVLNFEALPDNIKMTYPLIQIPKPAKKEKDFGLSGDIEIFTPTIKLVYLLKNNIWEKEDLKIEPADTEISIQKVIDEFGIQTKNDLRWNIESFGNYIMEQSLQDIKSIIETETNLTTILETLNLLIQRNTRTYIVELFGEMVKDIKFVESVDKKNTTLNITIQNKDGYSPSVKNVELKNLWSIKIAPSKSSHPTVKPIKLMSYLITLFTRPGDWVLDPFGGSGTTGLACKLLDRNHIYIDFTQEYYDIAEERMKVTKQDLKKLLKEKISNGQQELF